MFVMKSLLFFIGIVGLWIFLQAYLLPRMGVST